MVASVILYGRNPVREALRGRRRVARVWATVRAAREPWLATAPRVQVVSSDEIESRAQTTTHQGICAEVPPYPYAGEDELFARADPLLVALDGIEDPQNLGAICRSAECAGADGVVIPERRAAEITPAVAKASAGAIEHLRIARVRNLADFLEQAKRRGCWCYGAAADAPREYRQVDWTGGAVLVLGGEGRGLRPRVASVCDELVGIPLHGRLDSLNVSAAAAVLLYAALDARA